MDSKKNLAPEIRFKGYSGAWGQQKLGCFTTSYSGGTPPSGKPGYYGGSIPFIRSADINSDSTGLFLTEIGLNNSAAKMVSVDDILYALYGATSGEVGRSRLCGAINQAVLAIKPSGNNDSEFIAQWLASQKKKIVKTYLQGGQGNLSGDIVKGLIVTKPAEKAEQRSIGNFFRALDAAAGLQQRKLAGLRGLKGAYLQKMFPQAEEKVPKLRFAGFSGKWQVRKLGELFTERNERSANGDLISVTINSGVVKASDLKRRDTSSGDKLNYKKVEIGDIAYNSMRMWQGASGVSNYSGILSPAYTVIIPNHGVNPVFFSYLFKLPQMVKIFQSYSQGLTSDTWNLKFPLLKRVSVKVPSFEEQALISDFFLAMGQQINTQSEMLVRLKELKKAYLQKMFI
ncbi:MAG: restriction endonuclease subunit S [Clostridiales bacterium]|jgi:type I restriction enzyme S subunit|nr:restriction endonuclease subunit S [Clostridiales bacterium]